MVVIHGSISNYFLETEYTEYFVLYIFNKSAALEAIETFNQNLQFLISNIIGRRFGRGS